MNEFRFFRSRVLGVGLASILLGACGTNNDISTGPSNGVSGGNGSQGTGGTANAGGANPSNNTGGSQNSNGTGGSVATGGTSASNGTGGGTSATGGTTASKASTGGASTGGSSNASTGGRRSTGGVTATGGSPSTATGGRSTSMTTGGATTTGGVATGGTTTVGATTGGSRSTGGVAATGGAGTGGKATGGAATGGAGTGGSTSTCTPTSTKFSFFVTSQARLFSLAQTFNGSTKGFGGDFRYGQSTGLAGADKICTAIAEASMPGNCKTWRAFLSAADGGSGTQVNAISRIGSGPWYDRVGRLFGTNTTTIVATRPDAAATIVNDFPNEDGVLNHDALQSGNTTNQDNHDILTGTGTNGNLYSATGHCTNWTSSAANTSQKPRVGHSWPRQSESWISTLDESGCAPGVNLVDTGPPGNDGTVGSGGGYGGFYCFALTP